MLACGRRTVVAAGTVTGDRRMIEVRRYPAAGGVAGFTVIATLDMCGVLACGSGAVMAAGTDPDHIGMIHPYNRRPSRIAVTILTHVGSLDMGATLTRRRGAVVAGNAVTGQTGMVKIRRHPGIGGVAGFAIIATLHMGGVLAGGDAAVMTAGAGTHHLGMVDACRRHPGSIAVTGLTHIRSLDMCGTLTGRRRTIMTARAVAGNGGMIEVGRCPGIGGMADQAIFRRRNMGGMFARCSSAVMATAAGTDHIGMIN